MLDVNVEKQSWCRSKDILLHWTMDKKPAPDSLLKAIGCNSKFDCSMLRCSRRKDGYHLCGKYQIHGCTNEQISPEENENEMRGFDFGM